MLLKTDKIEPNALFIYLFILRLTLLPKKGGKYETNSIYTEAKARIHWVYLCC